MGRELVEEIVLGGVAGQIARFPTPVTPSAAGLSEGNSVWVKDATFLHAAHLATEGAISGVPLPPVTNAFFVKDVFAGKFVNLIS